MTDYKSVMEITTAVGCKVACRYCPQKLIKRAYAQRSTVLQMSYDVFKTCVDKIPLGVHLLFCGMSEPWLNPDCAKMLLYAHEKGHAISLDTTLIGITLADIEAIKSIPFGYFAVHLPSSQRQEAIRVDDDYQARLDAVQDKINPGKFYFHYYGAALHPRVKLEQAYQAYHIPLYSRAANIKIAGKMLPKRRQGAFQCQRSLRWNVLLPNGDVLICSADYGMKHTLGNLLTGDYASLFCGEPFLTVEKGLEDESLDIICRYCERYAVPPIEPVDEVGFRTMLRHLWNKAFGKNARNSQNQTGDK